MPDPFFSIVVPAYNAAGHIRALLDSIIHQTFQDYELIIVCDSCTDDTHDIACEYVRPNTYDSVFEVNYGRDGLSRDYGIRHASGQWILFADDDDWFLHESVFQELFEVANKTDANTDVIAFGYECRTRGMIYPSDRTIFKPRIDHVWSSCWRRSAIGNARFGDAVFSSDTYFLKDMRHHQYALYHAPLYYYNFLRTGSQTDLFCKGIIHQSPVAE